MTVQHLEVVNVVGCAAGNKLRKAVEEATKPVTLGVDHISGGYTSSLAEAPGGHKGRHLHDYRRTVLTQGGLTAVPGSGAGVGVTVGAVTLVIAAHVYTSLLGSYGANFTNTAGPDGGGLASW